MGGTTTRNVGGKFDWLDINLSTADGWIYKLDIVGCKEIDRVLRERKRQEE